MEINLADYEHFFSSVKRTKKVFKINDNTGEGVEVGILDQKNEIVFHKPVKERMSHSSLYDICFYIKDDNGEFLWLGAENKIAEDRALEREITITVDGLNCSIGYIDENDSVIFYDQY